MLPNVNTFDEKNYPMYQNFSSAPPPCPKMAEYGRGTTMSEPRSGEGGSMSAPHILMKGPCPLHTPPRIHHARHIANAHPI